MSLFQINPNSKPDPGLARIDLVGEDETSQIAQSGRCHSSAYGSHTKRREVEASRRV